MSTSSRIRTTFDFGRMREGVRGPGIDTRAWLAMARVDDDPDAIRWEEPHGWVVDVTFSSGPLDQEGPVPCRVMSTFAEAGATRQEPVARGCEVIIGVIDGDPNANPVILGQIHNGGGCEAPNEANGEPIDETRSLNAHLFVTPHQVEWDVGDIVRIRAAQNMTLESTGQKAQLLAQLVELADDGATQAFIRGTDFASALNSLLNAWAAEVTTAQAHASFESTAPGPLAPLNPTAAAWNTSLVNLQSAISAFQSRLVPGDLLSTRVKGE